jgi:hypothetical protein
VDFEIDAPKCMRAAAADMDILKPQHGCSRGDDQDRPR